MTRDDLYRALDYVNHSREKRAEMAALILENPNLVPHLLDIAFDVDDPISHRACWVMEFTAKEKLSYLYPYLDEFTSNLSRVHLDSAVRPVAKICEFLMKAYFLKKPVDSEASEENHLGKNSPEKSLDLMKGSEKSTLARKALTETHLEYITAACFDWLIGEHKVAAQAYSMTCLLLLGRKFDWIHPELKIILEQNYAKGSAAYKARARMTLEKLR